GQTIVIGGLFRDVVTSTDKQVPLLGDIPVLGESSSQPSHRLSHHPR
ncbi:MAG: hypothetical protein GY741_01665, partial [Phycisphaeraceae bacterium]|nr:hypothetical protein [Phycisphaeraceae bacterium]